MAQAEPNVTTRRGFSKWLAAASVAAAMPAPALATAVSQELIDGAKQAEGKWQAWIVAREHVAACQKRIERWENSFPCPDSSDDKYTMNEYWVVLNRDKADWHNRRMVALKESGVAKAKLVSNNLKDELFESISRFSNIKCSSIADLLFKAKSSISLDDDNALIANEVVFDLLQLHNIETSD